MKDFHEITTEPGKRPKNRKRRRKELEKRVRVSKRGTLEEHEEIVPTKLKYDDRMKADNEVANFAPMRRWLGSRVGKKWDNVWSEICSMEGGKFAGDHMRKHFKQLVGDASTPEQYRKFANFVVDDDGILRKGEERKYSRSKFIFRFIPMPNSEEKHGGIFPYSTYKIYKKVRNCWFIMTVKDRFDFLHKFQLNVKIDSAFKWNDVEEWVNATKWTNFRYREDKDKWYWHDAKADFFAYHYGNEKYSCIHMTQLSSKKVKELKLEEQLAKLGE